MEAELNPVPYAASEVTIRGSEAGTFFFRETFFCVIGTVGVGGHEISTTEPTKPSTVDDAFLPLTSAEHSTQA